MLEAPPTIRLPRKDELPNNPEVFERLKDLEKANIIQGFTLNKNTTHNLPFSFYAEINIDNSRLWNLLMVLCSDLPEEVTFIYNKYEEEPSYGTAFDKPSIFKFIENYKIELTQDCFLEWGIISNDPDSLEEIFISDSKFIKFWGGDETMFRLRMKEFKLQEISGLNFIDEFPKVVEALTLHNNLVKPTNLTLRNSIIILRIDSSLLVNIINNRMQITPICKAGQKNMFWPFFLYWRFG